MGVREEPKGQCASEKQLDSRRRHSRLTGGQYGNRHAYTSQTEPDRARQNQTGPDRARKKRGGAKIKGKTYTEQTDRVRKGAHITKLLYLINKLPVKSETSLYVHRSPALHGI